MTQPGFLWIDHEVYALASITLVDGAITFTASLPPEPATASTIPAGVHEWRITGPDGVSITSGVLRTERDRSPRTITFSAVVGAYASELADAP